MAREINPLKNPLTYFAINRILRIKIERDLAGKTRLASLEDHFVLVSDPKVRKNLRNSQAYSLEGYEIPIEF